MTLHPVAAWAEARNGKPLSQAELYRRFVRACLDLKIRPCVEGTLRNALAGRSNLSGRYVLAAAQITDGAVSEGQILDYQRARVAGRAR